MEHQLALNLQKTASCVKMASIVTFLANSFQEGIALLASFACGAMRGLALTPQYMSQTNNQVSAQKECTAKAKTC